MGFYTRGNVYEGFSNRRGQRQPTRCKILSAGGANVLTGSAPRFNIFPSRETLGKRKKKNFKLNFRIFTARVIIDTLHDIFLHSFINIYILIPFFWM